MCLISSFSSCPRLSAFPSQSSGNVIEMYKETQSLDIGWLQQIQKRQRERKVDFLVVKTEWLIFYLLVAGSLGELVNTYHCDELREGVMKAALWGCMEEAQGSTLGKSLRWLRRAQLVQRPWGWREVEPNIE